MPDLTNHIAIGEPNTKGKWVFLICLFGYTRELMPLPNNRIFEKVTWYFPLYKIVQGQLYQELEEESPE